MDGLFYGGGFDQLEKQALGVVVALLWSFGLSWVLATIVHRMMGFRIDEEHEVSGIDLVVHAETAYDLHVMGGGRSHGIFGHRDEPGKGLA